MRKRKIIIILLIVLLVIFISVLINLYNSGKYIESQVTNEYIVDTSEGYTRKDMMMPTESIVSKGSSTNEQEKIIKESDVIIQTDSYMNDIEKIYTLINNSNATVVEMNETQGNNYYDIMRVPSSKLKKSYIVIKIDANKFQDFNRNIRSIGSVISYSEDTQDISIEYSDIEAKISSYQNQERQLNELLKRAVDAKDLLEISNQLQSVIENREKLQRQIQLYDNRVSQSKIAIRVVEVESIEITEKGIIERVKDTFISSLNQLKEFSINLILFKVFALPFVLLGLIIILIIYFVIKVVRK